MGGFRKGNFCLLSIHKSCLRSGWVGQKVSKAAYVTYEWSLGDISEKFMKQKLMIQVSIRHEINNATSENISHHCRESRAFAEENCCRVYYMYF